MNRKTASWLFSLEGKSSPTPAGETLPQSTRKLPLEGFKDSAEGFVNQNKNSIDKLIEGK